MRDPLDLCLSFLRHEKRALDSGISKLKTAKLANHSFASFIEGYAPRDFEERIVGCENPMVRSYTGCMM